MDDEKRDRNKLSLDDEKLDDEKGDGIDQRLRTAFNMFDKSGKGSIGKADLKSLLKDMKVELTDEELKDILNDVDEDGSGHIEFAEFKAFMTREMSEGQRLKEIFELFDSDGDGYISIPELRQTLKQCEYNVTDEVVEQIMKEADINKDGKISFDEFKIFFRNKSLKK